VSASLEQAARWAWRAWSRYRKHTRCAACGQFTTCAARRSGGPFYCLGCWDQGEHER
jgi:hypothetical protein